MLDLPRSHLVIYAAAFAAIVLLGARQLARGSDAPAGGTGSVRAEPAPIRVQAEGAGGGGDRVVVHVAGAVRRPGVYRLRAGQRVDDAVRRAGGPTRRAQLDGLNLAARAEDGRQILVPERAPRARAGAGPASAEAAGGAAAAESGVAAGPVNLNTATLEQLDTLDGIGPGLAQAILDFREANGGFTSVEELGQVRGIGEKRLASLRAQVSV